MPRPTTVFLEAEFLAALFTAWDLWAKIRDGRLTTVEAANKRAIAKAYPGGISQILKHYSSNGTHICTTHRIIDESGSIAHWDEANLKVGGLTLVKPISTRVAA